MAASMIFSRTPKSLRYLLWNRARHLHSLSTEVADDDAHYPPVKPKYPPGEWGNMEPKVAWLWEDQRQKLEVLKTPDAKMKELTEKTYQVWKYTCVDPTPNTLDYQCNVTKTSLIKTLPNVYNEMVLDDVLYQRLKDVLIETITHEYEIHRSRFIKSVIETDIHTGRRRKNTVDYRLSKLMVKSIIMNLLANLGGDRQDISECCIDYDARVSAFWSRHGFLRKKSMIPPKDPNFVRQNNSMFYGEHIVDFQVRKRKPLPEFLASDEVKEIQGKDEENCSPRVLGQFMERIDRDSTGGINNGDPQVFNHLSFVLLNKDKLFYHQLRYGKQFSSMAETGYVMNTGFLSTVAQAHHLGFNEYEELTYPLTTQTVLTNGVDFILSAYQLNTLQLWKDNTANPVQNICWLTEKETLFQDIKDGKLEGFNDNLFRKLVKFFLIEPSDRQDIDLAPNLEEVPKTDIPYKKIFQVVHEDIVYDRS